MYTNASLFFGGNFKTSLATNASFQGLAVYETCAATFGTISDTTLLNWGPLLSFAPVSALEAIALSNNFHLVVEAFCALSDYMTVAQVRYFEIPP